MDKELVEENLQGQVEMKKIQKKLSVWGIMILLALLVLFGNWIGTKHTNAKYTGRVTSAADSARVAAVGGSVSITGSVSDIDPTTATWVNCYTFEVTNQESGSTRVSEVSLNYKIDTTITAPSGLEFQVIPETGTPADYCGITNTKTQNASDRTYSVTGGLFPVDSTKQTHTYVVQAKWINNQANFAGQPITINIKVEATQKD